MPEPIDLKAPEVQAAIQAAVDAAVQPLISKRDELLGEVKKLRKESTIKPEDVEKLETEIDELKGQLATAQKDAKTFKEAATKAEDSLKAESGFTQKLLVDNGLGEALIKANVTNPAHLKAVKSMLSGQVKIIADGESRKAMVGDKELSAFVTEWAASDEGKHFVSAPANSGGGSGGGSDNGQQSAKTSTQKIAAGLAKL